DHGERGEPHREPGGRPAARLRVQRQPDPAHARAHDARHARAGPAREPRDRPHRALRGAHAHRRGAAAVKRDAVPRASAAETVAAQGATYNPAMALAPVPELVAELAAGRMVILVD